MRSGTIRITRTLLALSLIAGSMAAQTKKGKPAAPPAAPAAAAPQKLDEEYTKLIKEYLQDPRISTELVDHMPASDTVPSPLKFLGRIPGTPGELTYAKDIDRYFQALANSSKRAKFWSLGTTEEGREEVVLAISDEATIASLDKYKAMTGSAWRSAKDYRSPGPGTDPHCQTDLLRRQRHPLARDRRSRNADRAGLPPDRGRHPVYPDHSQ